MLPGQCSPANAPRARLLAACVRPSRPHLMRSRLGHLARWQMFKDLFFREGYAYDHNFDWTLKNNGGGRHQQGDVAPPGSQTRGGREEPSARAAPK